MRQLGWMVTYLLDVLVLWIVSMGEVASPFIIFSASHITRKFFRRVKFSEPYEEIVFDVIEIKFLIPLLIRIRVANYPVFIGEI